MKSLVKEQRLVTIQGMRKTIYDFTGSSGNNVNVKSRSESVLVIEDKCEENLQHLTTKLGPCV